MYIYYQNTVCLPVSALFENEVINQTSYRNFTNRGHLNVVRRGGNGRGALIDAKKMRADLKAKVIQLFGEPTAQHAIQLVNYIEWSKEAEKFFRDYRYGDDKPLPEETINEYTTTVNILNAFQTLLKDVFNNVKITKGKLWENFANAVKNLPVRYINKLPSNARRLQARYKKFLKEGYKSIIHKNFGNEFTVKLNTEAKEWCLTRWCNQVNRCANLAQLHAEFNEIAPTKGWKTILEEKTFYNYIHNPEVEPLWWAHRYGEKSADEKFGFQHTRIQALRRDALWFSDGTKLNFYFQDENGTMQTAWVYEVMDAYSEVLLGYHIFKGAENFTAQYLAYKDAVKFAGHRPYEIKFDNQGGHKKLVASKFFNKLTKLAIRTKPYNGKSKTIESAFGRFQRQVMKRCWFFTGQNVTAHSIESKANLEFIQANKNNLPTFEEAIKTYAELRQVWNNMKHFKTELPRIEMYNQSHNDKAPSIDMWDMVNMFWVWHSRGEKLQPITFSPGGLSFTLNKAKYEYMVYNDNGLPDMDFIDRSVDKKFYLKYDPEMMDEVYLYEKDHGGERFVTIAKLKLNIHGATQDQEPGEMQHIRQVDDAKNAQRVKRVERMEDILESHGIAAWQQGFNTPKIKGIQTRSKKKQQTPEPALAEADHDKQISSLTFNDLYDEF